MKNQYSKLATMACVMAFSLFAFSASAQETNSNPLRARSEARKEMHSNMPMIKREIRVGSSTEMFRKANSERMEVARKMKRDVFQIRKDALVKQLNISIENLTNIAGRIAERIVKVESEGRNVTEAKASLVIANDKLVKAKAAVATFVAYVPPTASSTTAVEVDLEKPRQVGDAAIKAVKEARDAFKKVIQDIAKNMGNREKTGTTTIEANASVNN